MSEILKSPHVQKSIEAAHCGSEAEHLDKFFETLRTSEDKACYGYKTVMFALQAQAIKTLLISDNLFRSRDNSVRL